MKFVISKIAQISMFVLRMMGKIVNKELLVHLNMQPENGILIEMIIQMPGAWHRMSNLATRMKDLQRSEDFIIQFNWVHNMVLNWSGV